MRSIPKHGKANYAVPMACIPISLSPSMLKTIKKLVDRRIRSKILGSRPCIDTNLPTTQESEVEV